jgi:DNA repair exonuclease SbcCD ATPase subunit
VINFESIKFKNFRSYGNVFSEYNFKSGFDLISGSNGSGKTSLLQSMTYGLFGKIPKIKIQELINSTNGTDLQVHITFVKRKDRYTVIRGEKPKIFEIYKNGELIDQKSRSLDQQEFLEKEILGINLSSFQMLVSLDTALLNKSFITMQEFERRQFLETILDIRILFFINQIINQRTSLLKTSKTEIEYKIKTRREILDSETKKYNDIVRINKDITENGNSMILSRQSKVENLKEKLQKYTQAFQKIEDSKTVLVKFELMLEHITKEINSFTTQYKETEKKIIKLEAIKAAAIKCEECGHVNTTEEISEDYLNTLYETKTVLKENLKSLKEDYNRVKEDISVQSRIVNEENRLRANENTTREELNQALVELEKAKSFKLLPENKDEINKLETELEIFRTGYENILNTEEKLILIKKLVSDDGIKKKIFERYIPVFNKYLNEILLEFNLSYTIIFNDKFEISIYDRNEERGYHTFSASEKMRINLVIMFSFLRLIEKRNSFSMNILLIDELLDNALSAEVQELVLRFMKYKIENKDKIVVSHNNNINLELFDRTFSIVKEKGFSSIIIRN